MTPGLALFDTAIGPVGIAWTATALGAVQLPESTREATARRLARRAPGLAEAPPPPAVAAAIARIRAALDGAADPLADLVLDLDGVPSFDRGVYDIARGVAPGLTLTYGEVARRLGDVALSRRVGQALGRNPIPIVVPCHRILAQDGKAGGFSAPGGLETKMRLLSIERTHGPAAADLFPDLPLAVAPRRA